MCECCALALDPVVKVAVRWMISRDLQQLSDGQLKAAVYSCLILSYKLLSSLFVALDVDTPSDPHPPHASPVLS